MTDQHSPDKETTENTGPEKCGFVVVIGTPNAGKSTLMNAMVGEKVSIVTPKVQTTRMPVRGIVVKDNTQIIFVDTPGIFEPQKPLERAMVKSAWEGQADADTVLFLVDATRQKTNRIDPKTDHILQKLKKLNRARPCILAFNKIDKVKREDLLAMAKMFNDEHDFQKTYMISALKEDGIAELLGDLASEMPEGVWLFPEDQISDMPARMMAAEITREKLFLRLHQELPYALTVETESWEPFDDGSVKIGQVIYILRDNHKGIVLGKGGSNIKNVGEAARIELENILGQRVHLKLHVKVKENWVRDPERYRQIGLDYVS